MSDLPSSYEALSLPTIRLSHHPAGSPDVTPIVLVILDRPRNANAFNTDMMLSLERVFGTLSDDPRVRCVVLTGGDPQNKIFCAGMDLSFSSSGPSRESSEAGLSSQGLTRPPDALESVDRESHRDGGGRVSLAIFRCNKPVIAAMNGSAVGVGITMTLPCAIRVTHPAAKIGFVFSRRGLVMEATSSFFLPRLLGASRALHLATTGAVVPASDPLLDGLFTVMAPSPAEVLPRALAVAEDVAANCSAVSAVVMRDMILRGTGASPEEAHRTESRLLFDMFRGRDFVEGVRAFMEKRAPRMSGSVASDAPGAWPWWERDVDEPSGRDGKGGKARL